MLPDPAGRQGGAFAAAMQELSRAAQTDRRQPAPVDARGLLPAGSWPAEGVVQPGPAPVADGPVENPATTDGAARPADGPNLAADPAVPLLKAEPAIDRQPPAMAGDAVAPPDTAEPAAPAPRGAPMTPTARDDPTSAARQARPPEAHAASASPAALEAVHADQADGSAEGKPPPWPDGASSSRPSPEPRLQGSAAPELLAVPEAPGHGQLASIPGGAAPVAPAQAPSRFAPGAGGDDAAPALAQDPWRGGTAPGGGGQTLTRAMRMRELAGGHTPLRSDQPALGLDSPHEGVTSIIARPVGEAVGQGPSATQPAAPGSSVPAQIDAGPAPLAGGAQGPAIAGAALGQAPPAQSFTTSLSHVPLEASAGQPGASAPIDQLTLHLARALDEGRTEIRIRLQPEELGQVDIKLEFKELQLTARVSAERPETLELLQRDARALSRALREAGVELAEGDLTFTSGGRGGSAGFAPRERHGVHLAWLPPDDARWLAADPALMPAHGIVSLRDGRLDIRA